MARSEEERAYGREQMRRWRAANPERARQADQAWRAANPEKTRDASRRWREKHPEKVAAIREASAQANREYQREYYAKDENRERKRAIGREYYRANRDRQLANTAKNRLRKRHSLTPEGWKELLDAQGGICYLCGGPMDPAATDLDHDHRCCPHGYSCATCRRGFSCHNCNAIIGLAGDDPERLTTIAANLRAALDVVTDRLEKRPAQGSLFPGVPDQTEDQESELDRQMAAYGFDEEGF